MNLKNELASVLEAYRQLQWLYDDLGYRETQNRVIKSEATVNDLAEWKVEHWNELQELREIFGNIEINEHHEKG